MKVEQCSTKVISSKGYMKSQRFRELMTDAGLDKTENR